MKKRIFTIMLLSLTLLVVCTLTSTVCAVAGNYSKVSIITGEGEIPDDDAENVVVTINKAKLTWSEADPLLGRDVDGYWVGIKVEAPDDIDKEASTIDAVSANGQVLTRFVYDQIKDAETYTTLWKRVDDNTLNSNEDEITLIKYNCYWKKDDTTTTQTITIKLKKDAIELEKEGTVTVTIGDNKFTLTEGNTLSDLTNSEKEILNSYKIASEGYIFSHFENEQGKVIKEDDPIIEDVTLKPIFIADPNYVPATQSNDDFDNTPKTGVVDVVGYTLLVVIVSAIGIIVLNKKY